MIKLRFEPGKGLIIEQVEEKPKPVAPIIRERPIPEKPKTTSQLLARAIPLAYWRDEGSNITGC